MGGVRAVRLPGPDRLVSAEVASQPASRAAGTLLHCLAAVAARLAADTPMIRTSLTSKR